MALNPLSFSATITGNVTQKLKEVEAALGKIKDDFNFKVNIDESSINSLKSTLSQINGDGLKSLSEGMAAFRKEMANNKLNDFAGNANFEGAIAGLKKLEAEYMRFMASWKADASHGENSPINAHALATQMKTAVAEAQMAMRTAWGHAMQLTPEAANNLQSSLRAAFSNLHTLVSQQIAAGVMPNTQFKTAIKEIETQIGQIGAMGKDFGPMSSYITNTTEVASLLASAFQQVEGRLQLLKDSMASDNFQKMAKSATDAAEAVDKLTTSFGPLLAQLDKNQELKNFMTGLGEIVNSIRLLTKNSNALGVTAGPNMSADQMVQNLQRNVQKIDAALYRIREAKEQLKGGIEIGKSLGWDDSDARMQKMQSYLKYLTEYQQKLRELRSDAAAMSKPGATTELLGPTLNTSLRVVRQMCNEMKNYTASTNRATEQEKNFARALQLTTNSAKQQHQVLSDLRSMAMQYMSVYGAYGFAKEVAEVTGELELQKTALTSILNSATTASDMYGQIRDLSQMSPFTFMDLMKSTRQLAAFGIETKDLYGTMKALSDIGAGLNVDVNRLILAYGHTRSYGYLSGIQNRQFENAGIDMIGGLAKKYNDLADAERRAGREADYVTRKDIFRKMRERAIPFEDVQDVVMSLDQPGGKFYNMQEKQFDTLGGKLRNLKNNYNIMLSEMGQSTHGFLMGSVNAINTLTENWSTYGQIVADVAVSLGVAKASLLAINGLKFNLGAGASAFSSAIGQTKGFRRSDWAVGYGNVATPTRANILGKDYGTLVAQSKELTRAQKVQAVLHGRVNAEAIKQLVTEKVITQEYAERITKMGSFRRGIERARISVRMFGAELKAAFLNPTTAIFAVVGAAFSLWNYFRGLNATIESITNHTKDNAFRDANSLAQFRDENAEIYGKSELQLQAEMADRRMRIQKEQYEAYQKWSASANIQPGGDVFDNSKWENALKNVEAAVRAEDKAARIAIIEAKGAAAVLEDVQKQLENMDPLYKGDLFDINEFKNEAEQAYVVIEKLKNIEKARNFVTQHSGDFAAANDRTHNIFSDSFATDVKDYQNAIREENNALSQVGYAEMDKFMSQNKAYFEKVAEQFHLDMTKNRAQIFKYGLEIIAKEQRSSNEMANMWTVMSRDLRPVYSALRKKFVDEKELESEYGTMGRTAAKNFFDGFKEGAINSDSYSVVMADMMKALLEDDAFKVSDPEMQNRIITQMMLRLPKDVAYVTASRGGETNNKEVIDEAWKTTTQYIRGVVGPQLVEAFKGIATEANDVTTPEAQNAVQRVCAAMEHEFSGFSKWLKREEESWTAIVASAFEQARPSANDQWKTDANEFFGKTALAGVIRDCANAIDWLDKARKQVKETKEMIDGQKAHFEIELGIGATGSAKAFLDAYKEKYGLDLSKGYQWNVLQSSGEFDTAKKMYQGLLEIENIAGYKAKTGYDLDPQKDKNKKGSSAKTDKQADEWLELLRIIKEAYSWYKKWEKEVGKTAALAMVRNQFKNLLPEEVLKDIDHYDKYVQEIMDKAQARIDKYGKKDQKGYVYDKNRQVVRTGDGLKEDFQYQTFQELSKNYADSLGNALELVMTDYDMFRKVLEATGNEDVASMVLGTDYQWQSKAEVIRKWIEDVLASFGATGKVNLDASLGGVPLYQAGTEAISDYVKEALGEVDENGNLTKESAERIDGIVSVLTKWSDLQKTLVQDSITQYADLVKGLSDYSSQVARINGEYQAQFELAKNLSPRARKQAESVAAAERDRKLFELSPAYKNLMNNPLTTSKQAGLDAVAQAKDVYNELWRTGGMSADEYTKKMEELNEALRAIDTKAVDEWVLFLEGGMKSVREQRIAANKEVVASANRNIEVLTKESNEASAKGNIAGVAVAQAKIALEKDKRKKAQDEIDEDQGENDSADKFKRQVDAIVQGLQKFMSALDLVNGTMEKLGFGDTAVGKSLKNASTVGNSILSGASSLSALGPYGMMAGAALGMIGGIAQVHDDNLQSKIEDLQQDVRKIENYTQTIKQARERQLGYGANTSAARLKSLWNGGFGNATRNLDAATEAMRKYYNTAFAGTNAYNQEYNLLIQKRQAYIDMYNAEDAKKNSSLDQLEEYKSKISELDDQLMYFTEDLAKELWSIDVKDWASQFSDALMSAWENGTSAAQAYEETVRSIMQSVVKQMLTLGILEPMMENLRKQLFGTDGKGGLFDINDVQGSMPKVMDALAKYFGDGGEGQKYINAATEFLNGAEEVIEQYGGTLYNNGSSNTLSSGVQGMSENTADLLAGYINALRQDVSVMRILQTNFITQYWQEYMSATTSAYQSVAHIEQDVAAMRKVQSDMADTLENFYSKFRGVTTGAERIYVQ